MKSLHTAIITSLITIFGLTGCYTQLEYSQRVRRITDDRPARSYERDNRDDRVSDSGYMEEEREAYYDDYAYDEDDGYIPVYYKDYEVANWWNSCNCSPRYNYGYGGYDYYDPWYSDYSFHFSLGYHHWPYSSHWRWRHFGFGFHHNWFGMSLIWGSPFYYSHWYDPYYSPWWHGYHPYSYWDGYYYRPYWYGYGYYGGRYWGDGRDDHFTRSYRPRSIGTNRVSDGRHRSRSIDRSTTINRTDTGIRSRTGTSRLNRGDTPQNRSAVQPQPRSRGTDRMDIQRRSDSDSRQRSRGAVQRPSSRDYDSYIQRSRDEQHRRREALQRSSRTGMQGTDMERARQINPNSRTERSLIESQIRRQRAVQQDQDNERSSFFGRFRKMLDGGDSNSRSPFRINRSNSSDNRSFFRFRSRSNDNNSSFNRSRSSSDRSSVTRSRSSSSRSSTAPGRSRSSSSRSRGNN